MTREHNERMTQAYYTAVIPLMKKIPKLDALLAAPTQQRRQSKEQMVAVARAMVAALKAQRG